MHSLIAGTGRISRSCRNHHYLRRDVTCGKDALAMRNRWAIGVLLLCGGFYGICSGEESTILFWDDLQHGLRPPQARNPYEERIETDRHDFTQSAKTVGQGVFQIETGYTYFYLDEDDEIERAHATPELMLRYGLSEDIEFRFRWDYAWEFPDAEEHRHGAEDIRMAFKLGVSEFEGLRPESALEIRWTVPTGGAAWSTGQIEFGLDYIYDWQLTEHFTLYGSTGWNTTGLADFAYVGEHPDEDHFWEVTQSVAVGAELTERVTMYAEFFGLYTHGRERELNRTFFNIGVDYYLTDDVLLDVRFGTGLTRDAEDFFSGVGGAVRF
jgi:hypothetical protein